MSNDYEAYNVQNIKSSIFNNLNQNVKENVEFIECQNENNIKCQDLKTNLDEHYNVLKEKEKILNVSKDKRNQTKLSFTECDNKKKNCENNYKDILKKTEQLKKISKRRINNHNKRIIQNNINTTLTSLNRLYKLNGCDKINHCYDELDEARKSETEYKPLVGEHKQFKKEYYEKLDKYETCIDPTKNECKDKLMEYKKNSKNINKDLYYMKSNIENYANLEENKLLNDDMESKQAENEKTKQNFKLYENPSMDPSTLLESEICKNILVTTIGSVLLYYFFFEL